VKIVWVKVGGLWPLETGGRLRSFHLVSELSRRHSITLLTTHGRADDPGELARRLPRCEVVSFPFDIPKRASAAFARALLQSWLSPLPVDLLKFRVPALAMEVRRRIEEGGLDLCVADFLSATVNVPLPGPLPVLFFAHNVEHVIWRRLGAVEARPWRRAALAIEWRKMRRAEGRVCARAHLTVAVSEADAAILAAGAPGATVHAVPTGVDASYFTPDGTAPAGPSLVFTGSMDWYPNEDAVLHFLKSILPRVRDQVPGASFSVVGRNPTARLRAAAEAAGARVTGTVPDVRPYLAEAAVYVVPLRIGGGTRLKIFEALAAGKAVVSTGIGAEGLPLVPGRHFLRADDEEDFARAVVSLLRDPGQRGRLGAEGRRLVEERFGWPEVAMDFETRCEGAVQRAGADRRAHRTFARSWLPEGIRRFVRVHRGLTPRQILIYWRLRVRRALRLGQSEPAAAAHPIRSVVYICRGNIIRSPMAEALLKRNLGDLGQGGVAVASAGLYARRGKPADPRARVAARQFGIDLEGHQARPLTRALVQSAGLIVPLDFLIEAELRGRFPHASHKILPLHAEDGERRPRPIEIPDPYDGDVAEIRRCYELLRSCVRRQAQELCARRPEEQEVKTRHAR
jgi:protein-tyrosine-phosphatase/glycosyltransferase involved in cell wall biosynthesis